MRPVKIVLCFIALSAWCVEHFEIPHTWTRRLHDPKVVYTLTKMPEGLDRFHLTCQNTGGKVRLWSSDYVAECTFGAGSASTGANVFTITVGRSDSDDRYNAFVFSTPTSNSQGEITLMPPMHKRLALHVFSLGPSSEEPDCFCEYSAKPNSFTINRFLRKYPDGSQFFVGVTFWYKHLEKVRVSYGPWLSESDDPGPLLSKLEYLNCDFTSCLQSTLDA